MLKVNKDIYATEDTRSIYQDISPLIENKSIDDAFRRYEKIANRAKKIYHLLGKLSILSIALGAIYTVGEALILPNVNWVRLVGVIIAILAGLGVLTQIFILITRQKRTWLLNRYAAERLRSLKFQAYQFAHIAIDKEELALLVKEYSLREAVKVSNEINGGNAIIKNFNPSNVLAVNAMPRRAKNSFIANMARDAFVELRINYQRRFAQSELQQGQDTDRFFNFSEDFSYLAAAVLTFLSLGMKMTSKDNLPLDASWVDFCAVAFFIIGASHSILNNASIAKQSVSRFEQYIRDIDFISAPQAIAKMNLPDVIEKMESLSLQELDNFCRAGARISYRL